MTELKYTLCFCVQDDKVLMLRRKKNPNIHLWNGLGGKIESGETPLESVQREILEEAGMNIEKNASIKDCGIVTWAYLPNKIALIGMHLFIARLSNQKEIQDEDSETEEGILKWLPLSWVCDMNNSEIVSNIPIFLSKALTETNKKQYHFIYESDSIQTVEITELN